MNVYYYSILFIKNIYIAVLLFALALIAQWRATNYRKLRSLGQGNQATSARQESVKYSTSLLLSPNKYYN